MKTEILELDPSKVKPFIHRARESEGFRGVKSSVAQYGQVLPGQVRDIRHIPESERKRPEGGLYDYALVTGEGRLETARQQGRPFRATVLRENDAKKVVGYFLEENLNRVSYTAEQLGRLLKAEVDAGMSVQDAAKLLNISLPYAQRLLFAVNHIAADVDTAGMSLRDLEKLGKLPKDHQKVVLETLSEVGIKDISIGVRKAKEVTDLTGLSKTALKKSLQRVDEDLERIRKRLKIVRRDHEFGPGNLRVLLAEKKFRSALEKAGVNVRRFEETK